MPFTILLAFLLAAAPPARAELRPALFGEGVFTTGDYDFFVALRRCALVARSRS